MILLAVSLVHGQNGTGPYAECSIMPQMFQNGIPVQSAIGGYDDQGASMTMATINWGDGQSDSTTQSNYLTGICDPRLNWAIPPTFGAIWTHTYQTMLKSVTVSMTLQDSLGRTTTLQWTMPDAPTASGGGGMPSRHTW